MPSGPTKPPAKKGGGFSLTTKYGPLPAWGWLAVAVVGYIIYKKIYNPSGSASNPGVSTAAAYTPPNETITLPSGASYTGPYGGAPPAFTQVPAAAATTPGQGGSTPGNGATPAAPGFGDISIAGGPNPGEYVVLGQAGGQVYQVGGGSPVYFGNANAVAQGPAAQSAAAASGGYAYTPVSYSQFVGSSPQQQQPGQLR